MALRVCCEVWFLGVDLEVYVPFCNRIIPKDQVQIYALGQIIACWLFFVLANDKYI